MNNLIDLLMVLKNKDSYFLISVVFTAISSILISLILLIFSSYLPGFLPLFYSLPWGEKQLATTSQVFILPGLLVVFSIVNAVFALQLHSSQIILRRMLLLASVAVDLIIVLSFIRIIFIFI